MSRRQRPERHLPVQIGRRLMGASDADMTMDEDVRSRIAQTIPTIVERYAVVVEKMQRHLASMETADEAFGQGEVSAAVLCELLLRSAREIAATGGVRPLAEDRSEHARLDIGEIHYLRFGRMLGAVLDEVYGLALPPRSTAAWVDGFWFVGRALTGQPAHSSAARPEQVRDR